uniref:Uncharacterized protein n=1 Tax=Caenorhabditis japonica TaxID=281687 RepID=A0A8R1I762_CAEJA
MGLAAKSGSHSRVTAESQQRRAPCHSSVAHSALTGFRDAVIIGIAILGGNRSDEALDSGWNTGWNSDLTILLIGMKKER